MSTPDILKGVQNAIIQKIEDEKQVRGRAAIKQIAAKHTYGYVISIGVQILRQCNCPLELAYPVMRLTYRSLQPSLKNEEMYDFSSFRQNVLLQLKDTFSELDSNSPLRPSISLHATNVSSIKHRGARMEDNFIFVPNLWDLVDAEKEQPPVSLFAVLDGHNGSEAAEHCTALLVQEAVQQLCRDGRSTRDFLGDVFQMMESSLLDCRKEFKWSGGTTCTVCVISRGYLHTAWVGDSFAWLFFASGPALQLTDRVHRPSVASERALVQQNGGWVSDSSPPRVCGLLGITRSLGDAHLKVCALPSMTSVKLNGDEVALVIASDGLWDAKGCHGDGDNLATLLRSEDRDQMAERVTQRAVSGGSNDNITVGIAWLDRCLPGAPEAHPHHSRSASDVGARAPRFSSPPRELVREASG